MLYLSTTEAGGRTVFPQIALSVTPQAGDALFWYNLVMKQRLTFSTSIFPQDAAGDYDSRNFHLGCPVLHGNKWIANKWIKANAQYQSHLCPIDGGPYKPYTNL